MNDKSHSSTVWTESTWSRFVGYMNVEMLKIEHENRIISFRSQSYRFEHLFMVRTNVIFSHLTLNRPSCCCFFYRFFLYWIDSCCCLAFTDSLRIRNVTTNECAMLTKYSDDFDFAYEILTTFILYATENRNECNTYKRKKEKDEGQKEKENWKEKKWRKKSSSIQMMQIPIGMIRSFAFCIPICPSFDSVFCMSQSIAM